MASARTPPKSSPPAIRPFARLPVLSAALALAGALIVLVGQYGYHRDELYFRMLPPAWGYVDQPPLTPLLARLFSVGVADELWAVRIPAIVFAVASVVVVALITREVGGGRLAQGLAAWGYAFASMTLAFGHVLLTASLDLLVWPAVILLVIRVLLRGEPRWWLLVGAIVGVSMYNKLLIGMLLISVAAGLLVLGPRRALWSRWVAAGALIALVIAAPNLIYQAVNGWPQLEMGAALSANNAGEVRSSMWLFLLLMLGPPLVPFWVAGIVSLARRPGWWPIRFLLVAFPVLLVLVFAAGSQFYYPYGLLAALYAIGCVAVADFAASRVWGRALVIGAVALNSVVSAVISLPVVPLAALSSTPIADVNPAAADQVGWPEYAAQVWRAAEAAGSAPGGEDLVILASNYGLAGALDRFGAKGLPEVYSGHNALHALGRPPDSADTALVVGGMLPSVEPYFRDCAVVDRLESGFDVDNEEEGQPIALCRGRLQSWEVIWPRLAHLD